MVSIGNRSGSRPRSASSSRRRAARWWVCGLAEPKTKPSPVRAARCSCGSAPPPNHSGMSPRTGRGARPARSIQVELSAEVDHGLAPQRSKYVDLLVEAAAAGLERCAEALVLDVVPAGTDREHQSAAREDVDLGCLFGNQRASGVAAGRAPRRLEFDGARAGGEDTRAGQAVRGTGRARCTGRSGAVLRSAWTAPRTWSYTSNRR